MSKDAVAMFEEIMELILSDAAKIRTNASFSGSWGDGGASDLEKQVRFFKYGMNLALPPEWEHYNQRLDPEYTEFLRLKKKFEG
jgi:hypothetical protein